MKYNEKVTLKDGRICTLRNCEVKDTPRVIAIFNLTHAQTDFLLSYPDECTFTEEEESKFLGAMEENPRGIEILAEIDGAIVGMAGFDGVGSQYKKAHRAELGISVDKNYWGIGVGKALMNACINCARTADYEQLELDVVSENERAISLYEKYGFVEYGRNPKGFRRRGGGYQELVLMRLELK